MPCLNNKQHRHNIFHKVKQILIMLLSCIYILEKSFCLLFGVFFDNVHVEARGTDGHIYSEKKKKSNVNCSLGHNPFPPPQHFPAWTLSPLPMFAHCIPILCPHQARRCAACAGWPQGVPRPPVPARTSHRHTALMEVHCCASVSNTHNEISIWIVLIKLPVALNPGSIRCKWITINFTPFLRALYTHGQQRKHCSGYSQGRLSLTMTWNFWEWRNHRSIFS